MFNYCSGSFYFKSFTYKCGFVYFGVLGYCKCFIFSVPVNVVSAGSCNKLSCAVTKGFLLLCCVNLEKLLPGINSLFWEMS